MIIKDTVFILSEYFDYVITEVLPELNCTILPEESDKGFGMVTVQGEIQDIKNFQDFLLGKLYI